MSTSVACHLCGSHQLEMIASPASLPAVSSDIQLVAGDIHLAVCRGCGTLQKLFTPEWQHDVAAIYAGYSINHQSGGADPYIFNSLYGPGPRADILTSHLRAQCTLPQVGRLLDIGCGNGNILRGFARGFPGWALHGVDSSGRWESEILSIPGVSGFHRELPPPGDLRFDVIIMSHVLEHITDPASYLRHLQRYLTPQGLLFIAVPDVRQNPIDLFVFDHCTHFDEPTLAQVFSAAGFNALSLRSDVLGKEIVAVCIEGEPAPAPDDYSLSLATVGRHYVELCRRLLQHAKEVRATQAHMYVMGTSTAAAMLASGLEMRVEGFVDEDPERIGRQAFGKPILALGQVPAGGCVYIPMASDKAREIITRAARDDLQFAYLADNDVSMARKRA